MATLTVWRFDGADGADGAGRARDTLRGLAAQGLVTVQDTATVSWAPGAARPHTHRPHDTGTGLGGGFWGLLLGLVFYVPQLGAAAGALAGALTELGIDDGVLTRLRDRITPGTSALFAVTSGAVPESVREAFTGRHTELVSTHLSHDQEDALREVFAG